MALLRSRILCKSHKILRFDNSSNLIIIGSCERSISLVTLDLDDIAIVTASHTLLFVEVVGSKVGDDILTKAKEFLET